VAGRVVLMPVVYIGIDPGGSGAVVGLPWSGSHAGPPVAVRADGPGGYQRSALKAGLTVSLYLQALRTVADGNTVGGVLVEMPSTRPGESASSGQRSGMHVGAWLGLLAALGWPYEVIRPQSWRRLAGIVVPAKGDPKAATLSAVMARIPDLDLMPGAVRTPHDGIADAAGLALAARGRFS